MSLKHGTIKHPETSSNVTRLRNSTIEQAIPFMFAYHYGNQALQLLVHMSMVCLSLGNDGNSLHDEGEYKFVIIASDTLYISTFYFIYYFYIYEIYNLEMLFYFFYQQL